MHIKFLMHGKATQDRVKQKASQIELLFFMLCDALRGTYNPKGKSPNQASAMYWLTMKVDMTLCETAKLQTHF